MKQQTAVEWLVDKLLKGEFINDTDFLIEKAKEMEKQQIIDANLDGQSLVSCKYEYAEQYYNETYSK